MNKKLIGIILILGAIIAIGLGIMLSFKTKELKAHLQQTLNEKFESFTQGSDLISSWESFSCSGFTSVSCYSPKIVVGDEYTKFIFKNVGFDVDSVDESSLRASFNIKEIKMEVELDEANYEQEKENLALFSRFLPHKTKCDILLKRNEDKLSESLQCAINADNATYTLQVDDIYQYEDFKTQNIAQILESFYSNIFVEEEDFSTLDKYKYALNNLLFKVKENGFSKDIYKYYELQSKEQGGSVSEEGFKQYASNVNMIITIALGLVMGDAYSDGIMSLSNAAQSFILGQNKEFGFTFKLKDGKQEEFIPLGEFSQDPFLFLAENFTFEALSK